MIAASVGFAIMGTVVKAVSVSIPTGEIVLWRSILTTLVVLGVAVQSRGSLVPVNVGMHLVRGLMGVSSMALYFTAITRLPLGDAVLLTYLSPLLVAAMAPWTVGETPSRRVWAALGIGIGGVALVVGPVGQDDPIGVVCALAAAFFAASSYLSVRVLTRTDTPIAIVWWFSVIATATSSVALVDGMTPITRSVFGELVIIGVMGAFAQWSLTRAYASAPASQVSVYAYSTPVFAYVTGLLVLGEVPRWTSVIGAGFVVLAGTIVARE